MTISPDLVEEGAHLNPSTPTISAGMGFGIWLAERLTNYAPIRASEYEQYYAWARQHTRPALPRALWWSVLSDLLCGSDVARIDGRAERVYRVAPFDQAGDEL